MKDNKMDLNQLMKIDVSNLAETQYKALQQHVLETLKEIATLVKNEDYQGVEGRLESSWSGDGYGQDNRYINFGYSFNDPMDIEMILEKLSTLKGTYATETGDNPRWKV